MTGVFVHDDRLADTRLSEHHPFDPSRSRRTLELCRRLGLVDRPDVRLVEPRALDESVLLRVHDAGYVDALRRANTAIHDDVLLYNLGRTECPVFPGVFDYAVGCVAATLTAMEELADGGATVAFNPLGGMHHAMPGRAEGFCYLNDPAVALDLLAERGRRPLYLDLDAHHGNGVQHVFYERDDVMTISVHQSGMTLYPWSGFETEIGEGPGRGHNVNFPLPLETDDELFGAVLEAVVEPLIAAFAPDVVVLVMGMDVVGTDPLTQLRMTNNGVERAVRAVATLDLPVLALGGGGYDMDAVARGWTLGWAALNGFEVAPPDPMLGGSFRGSEELGASSIRDMHVSVTGEIRQRNVDECVRVERFLKREVFPIHGIG